MNSIFIMVIGLLNYIFHIGWVVVVCGFRGMGPFHLSCYVYVCRLVCSLMRSAGSVLMFPVSLLILIMWLLSLFHCQSCSRFASFTDLFREAAFVFTDFSFLNFNFVDFLLFIISFLLLALGLFCSF